MRHRKRLGLRTVTAASETALTTKARARAAPQGAGLSADDGELDRQIAVFSRAICDYLKIRPTLDGRCTLAVERVSEKIDFRRATESFYLSRAPVIFVSGDPQFHLVMLDDDVLLASELEVLSADGLCRFVDDNGEPREAVGEAVIEYTAGYNLPSTATPNPNAQDLPPAIEEALFILLKAGASSAQRDPAIRSQASEEVDSFTYFAEGAMNVAWREAEFHLAPFRRIYG